MAEYFDFEDTSETAFTPDEVVLFSGGQDSLSGAIKELSQPGHNIALVSHRSASKIAGVQKHLVEQLRSKFGADRVLHVPVWRISTAVLAASQPPGRGHSCSPRSHGNGPPVRSRSCTFFENGVVSLNLPLAGHVVGARATRTTHPQALAGFGSVFFEVLGRHFGVENPFVWNTKTEVSNGFRRMRAAT